MTIVWEYTGKTRPPFAEEPGEGQESVWDYPRPPILVPCDALVEVGEPGRTLARTRQALRVLETASPPTYYLPPDSVDWQRLVRTDDASFCEWKGTATYWALADNAAAGPVAWSYENPSERFAAIDGHLSCYPARIPCFVDGERVQPQPGGFYGGWMTSTIVGPVKGGPGTGHW
ncbi:MAG: DUF427 domain-containing protein [Halioglobus sp.]|nr:DUF427 domain-containing protein [Halioglobus sp.]